MMLRGVSARGSRSARSLPAEQEWQASLVEILRHFWCAEKLLSLVI
jgi:hypothetical protein